MHCQLFKAIIFAYLLFFKTHMFGDGGEPTVLMFFQKSSLFQLNKKVKKLYFLHCKI